MTEDRLLDVLRACADAVADALAACDAWWEPTERPSQHRCDVVADQAAVELLLEEGCGVLSEESGRTHLDREAVVVLDPVDGTANAVAGRPWYGPSLCGVLRGRPTAALIRNLASGEQVEGLRGAGIVRDGRSVSPRTRQDRRDVVVAVSGRGELPWNEVRLGAVAFALAAVATGEVDGFVDLDDHHHRTWDIAAGLFLCREAGAVVVDGLGRSLRDPFALEPRAPVAASDGRLVLELLADRQRALRSGAGGLDRHQVG